jgi:hypothetical protein
MIKRLPIILATVLTLLVMSATALAKPDNVAPTQAYIRAYHVLWNTIKARLPAQRKAAADLVSKISNQCPGDLAGSPRNAASTELSLEALGAVSIVMSAPDRPAIVHFARSVKGLQWSSPKLTRIVKAYAAKLKAEAALPAPNLCSDTQAWALTGFLTLPVSVTRFNQLSNSAEKGPDEVPSRLFVSNTDLREKRILHNLKHLEIETEAVELTIGVYAWAQILKAVDLQV